jgi:hypothetical protein
MSVRSIADFSMLLKMPHMRAPFAVVGEARLLSSSAACQLAPCASADEDALRLGAKDGARIRKGAEARLLHEMSHAFCRSWCHRTTYRIPSPAHYCFSTNVHCRAATALHPAHTKSVGGRRKAGVRRQAEDRQHANWCDTVFQADNQRTGRPVLHMPGPASSATCSCEEHAVKDRHRPSEALERAG